MQTAIVMGFPKCGTTAFCRQVSELNNAYVLMDHIDGKFECHYLDSEDNMRLYRLKLKEAKAMNPSIKLCVHKNVTYIYYDQYIKRGHDAGAKAIVFVRSLKKQLISWFLMHKFLANRGTPKNHPVNKTKEIREFYRSCNIKDYFMVFAKEKFVHRERVESLLNIFPVQDVCVISQEYLASKPACVYGLLENFLGLPLDSSQIEPQSSLSNAESNKDIMDDHLKTEIEFQNDKLFSYLVSSIPVENRMLWI